MGKIENKNWNVKVIYHFTITRSFIVFIERGTSNVTCAHKNNTKVDIYPSLGLSSFLMCKVYNIYDLNFSSRHITLIVVKFSL